MSVYHDAYETVVYDLDGTLVDLVVDWATVADDVVAVYEAADREPPSTELWDLLEVAPEYDLGEAVEEAIAAHERAGARVSDRLALADELTPELADRTGVCSLNCEDAVRIALETHDLMDGVGAVVGRDTVATQKPDPGSLLATVDRLGGDPSETVFVGDSERDAITAERAGIDFRYV